MTELGDPLEVPSAQRLPAQACLGITRFCGDWRGTGKGDGGSFPGMEVQGGSPARVGESKADHQTGGGGRKVQNERRHREEKKGSLCPKVTPVSPAPSLPIALHEHLLKHHTNQTHLKTDLSLDELQTNNCRRLFIVNRQTTEKRKACKHAMWQAGFESVGSKL